MTALAILGWVVMGLFVALLLAVALAAAVALVVAIREELANRKAG